MKKTESTYSRENDLLDEFLKANKIVKKFHLNIKEFQDVGLWEIVRKNNRIDQWIVMAFAWRKTPKAEGYEYWQNINNKFLTYLNSNQTLT